ncbi:MAG: hypothetical protein SGARI_002835 [Bacillariaceae sp.]
MTSTAVPPALYPPASTKAPSTFSKMTQPKVDGIKQQPKKKTSSGVAGYPLWMIVVATFGFTLFFAMVLVPSMMGQTPIFTSTTQSRPSMSFEEELPPAMSPFAAPLKESSYNNKFEFQDRHPHHRREPSYSPPHSDYHGHDYRQGRRQDRQESWEGRHHREETSGKGNSSDTPIVQSLQFLTSLMWVGFFVCSFAWLTVKQEETKKAKAKAGVPKAAAPARSPSITRKNSTPKSKVSFATGVPSTPTTKAGKVHTPTPHPSRTLRPKSGRSPFNSPAVGIAAPRSVSPPTTPPKTKKKKASKSKPTMSADRRREIHARMQAQYDAAKAHRENIRSSSANAPPAQPMPTPPRRGRKWKDQRDAARARAKAFFGPGS